MGLTPSVPHLQLAQTIADLTEALTRSEAETREQRERCVDPPASENQGSPCPVLTPQPPMLRDPRQPGSDSSPPQGGALRTGPSSTVKSGRGGRGTQGSAGGGTGASGCPGGPVGAGEGG